MSVKIFISYRHIQPDETLAKRLQESLEAEAAQVYIDFKNTFGEKWAKAIDEALRACDVLLLLLSPESAQSEPVVAEVRTAKQLAEKNFGKPRIFPVRIAIPYNEPLPYEMNIAVGSLQQVYWDGKTDIEGLVKRVVPHLTTPEVQLDELEFRTEEAPPESHRKREKAVPTELRKPVPVVDPRCLEDLYTPGGAIGVDDPFYIVRESDHDVLSAVLEDRALVTVRAARQMGKTSLILRTACHAHQKNIRVAFIDFQALPTNCFQNVNCLWKAVAKRIESDLKLPKFVKDKWDDKDDADLNLEAFANAAQSGSEINSTLICMDEVDRVFDTAASDAFFSILRAIHSKAAFAPEWEKFRWLLAGSTEPVFFIKNLHQSPFNIGLRVELRDFSETEVDELAKRYHCQANEGLLSKLYELLNGHPYLTQLAFYSDAIGRIKLPQIVSKAKTKETLFREHLHRFHLQLLSDRELGKAMYAIVKGKRGVVPKTIARLQGAGLVRPEGQKFIPRCKLYKYYFSENLKES